MTPRLLTALIQNGAAMPKAAVDAPPSAGPTARLILKPTLLAVIAGVQVLLRHELRRNRLPGRAPSARPKAPIRNVNTAGVAGVTRSNATRAANSAAIAVLAALAADQEGRRLSTMSASAPAGQREQEHRQAGGDLDQRHDQRIGSRLVISQPEAAVYIQVPMLETTVGGPDHRERRMAERTEGRAGRRLRVVADRAWGFACRHPRQLGRADRKYQRQCTLALRSLTCSCTRYQIPRQKKRCNGQNGSLKIVATGEKEDPPLAA